MDGWNLLIYFTKVKKICVSFWKSLIGLMTGSQMDSSVSLNTEINEEIEIPTILHFRRLKVIFINIIDNEREVRQ